MPFVEVEQPNYDSHADNFEWHKALLPTLDHAWSGLLQDLSERGLLQEHAGRVDGRVRPHAAASTIAPAATTTPGPSAPCWRAAASAAAWRMGRPTRTAPSSRSNPVNEGDLFATIYTALGVNPRVRHFVGTRPVWATPESARVVREILA